MKPFTRNLVPGDGPLIITESDGVTQISYQMSTGTGDNGTVTGTGGFAGLASQAIELPAGGGNALQSAPNSPIEITLECLQGTLKIILSN